MRFRIPLRAPNEVPIVEERPQVADGEKSIGAATPEVDNAGITTEAKDDRIEVNKEFQHGLQAAEAMTQVWTRNHLIMAYIL